MKRTLVLLLIVCLVLTGCATTSPKDVVTTPAPTSAPTNPTTIPTTPAPTEPTTPAPTTEPTTPAPTTPPETTPAPTEPPLPYTHPITGEGCAEPATNRPVAVVINNISTAQPLHGIGAADVICEITAEGGGTITRMLAIFTDLEAAGAIGSVRSARTYLIDLARAFDGILVHCGYSEYAKQELSSSGWASINEFFNGKYFYRDQDRLNMGYSGEHTLFTTGELLRKAVTAHGYRSTLREGKTFGLTFAEEIDLNGSSAKSFTMHYYQNGKTTTMNYNPETGCYQATQYWKERGSEELLDGNTKEAVQFRNVFVLRARTTSDGYRMFAQLTGEGTGYYACGGEYVEITWKRKSATDPFTYFLADGTPLTVGVGKTFIGVIPNAGGVVEFQ